MTDKASDVRAAYAAAYTVAISAIDAYELAIADSRRATSRESYYMAFNDVIRAARAARDAIDASFKAEADIYSVIEESV